MGWLIACSLFFGSLLIISVVWGYLKLIATSKIEEIPAPVEEPEEIFPYSKSVGYRGP